MKIDPNPNGQNAPDSTLIEGRGMGARTRRRWLVRDVDLRIRRGEIVTLIGPNGAGKSTTAKLAMGLMPLDAGSLWRSPKLRIGYVPQRLQIDWSLPLSVTRFMRLTDPVDGPSITSALEATGALHLQNEAMQTLSGGEFQRVQLARAVARQPDLLVLDEPVQGVDFNGEVALYRLIAEIRDEIGCGILLISHDLNVVMAQTDQVLCLNGHVCCSGTPQAVAADPAYRTLFGERTHALYQHQHDHNHDHDHDHDRNNNRHDF